MTRSGMRDAGDLLPKEPAVSVAIITYNHERFIAQAIDSALAQNTSFAIEVVIGDDHSTDRTADIIRTYQRDCPDRVRLILQPKNVGANRNMMSVIGACRGQYIALLEGDDYWIDTGKLQAQYDAIEASPGALMCAARALVWRDGDPEAHGIAPEGDSATLSRYGSAELVRGLWWFRTCTVMYPARMLRQVPGRFGSDWSGTLWLIARNPEARVVFLDRVVGVYRLHAGGSWTGAAQWQRTANDVNTLLNVIPLFSGEDRAVLVGQLHESVSSLMDDPEAPALSRLRAALLALARRPLDRSSWRNSLRLARFVRR